MSAVDQAKLRAEMTSSMFADRLRYFVAKWAPRRDLADRDAFQQDLMRLFVDAMQNQSATMALGIETYASDAMLHRSMAPLHFIMEREPKP